MICSHYMDMSIRLWTPLLLVITLATVAAQTPATPIDPIAAILDTFRTHDIVAVSSPNGNVQMQVLLLALIRTPRFADAVNDIVIETASARYQDVIDRFVRGDDIQREVLRKAWEDHTVPNSGLSAQTEEFIRAVRAVNASLGGNKKLRVIAGDPPIDWDNVTSREDHRRWIELRDTYPADVIRRQILDRGQKALVIYGQGHLQRRQIVSNYDMSTWQAQTVISLLARDPSVRLFTVWTLFDRDVQLPDPVASWPVPSLAATRRTTLGAADFAIFNRGLGDGTRFAVRSGQLVPLPREAWQTMRMEDQFDAVLYLGPPSSLTYARVPAALCQDQRFVTKRLERLTRFAPPPEVENFRKACGL
jgi:hypothetical protein